MVERKTQEGMTAPNPETKTRVLETTLAELGVDTSYDKLNLASDRFTLGVKKDGEDTVYVGLLKHPLAGGHFAQFLNNVSPFPDQGFIGVIGDINLPILVERDYKGNYQDSRALSTSGNIRLHERHLNDPRVGPAYIRFVEDHADSWFRALEFYTGWIVFDELNKVVRQRFSDLKPYSTIKTSATVGHILSGKAKIELDSNGRDVVVSDENSETKVVIGPTGQNSERFSWKVIEYQFPAGYKESSLYPIVAWKLDANGNRSFLTQKEAMQYVREFGLEEGEQGDVKLGEVGVAYFARDIIKDWPAKMTLKPLSGVKRSYDGTDDFEQPMRGGQMPAWVGIERHKEQLLKSETSVLALLERKFTPT